jgi:hypothetical protein
MAEIYNKTNMNNQFNETYIEVIETRCAWTSLFEMMQKNAVSVVSGHGERRSCDFIAGGKAAQRQIAPKRVWNQSAHGPASLE